MEQVIGMIVQGIGWAGAAAMLMAYHLVATRKIAPDSMTYHALNVSGAVGLALVCLWTQAWPSVVTNLAFIAIGLFVVFSTKRHLLGGRGRGAVLSRGSFPSPLTPMGRGFF